MYAVHRSLSLVSPENLLGKKSICRRVGVDGVVLVVILLTKSKLESMKNFFFYKADLKCTNPTAKLVIAGVTYCYDLNKE